MRNISLILTLLITWISISTASGQNNQPGFGAPPPVSFGAPPPSTSNPGSGGLNAQPSARIATLPTNSSTVPDLSKSSLTSNNEATSSGLPEMIRTNSIFGVIRDGGILMFPILFCSFVLLVFVFERLLFLRRGRVIPKPFVRGVIEQLEQQQLDQEEAIALCEKNGSPMAELFAAALKKWGRPAVEIEQAVVDAGAHIISRLKKYLRLFNAISNLTPLLGLLGTVLGMIEAFNSIAQAGAMGRPELLANGIGTALITTAGGLCVAIPAYAAYVYFVGLADKLILEMDAHVANVIELTCAEAQNSRSRRTRKAA
jgi:biopolymer transport protein ExbB